MEIIGLDGGRRDKFITVFTETWRQFRIRGWNISFLGDLSLYENVIVYFSFTFESAFCNMKYPLSLPLLFFPFASQCFNGRRRSWQKKYRFYVTSYCTPVIRNWYWKQFGIILLYIFNTISSNYTSNIIRNEIIQSYQQH